MHGPLNANRLVEAYVALGYILMLEEADGRWWADVAKTARVALGLPPYKPLSPDKTLVAARALIGGAFDGVDVDAFMREVRGGDDEDTGVHVDAF